MFSTDLPLANNSCRASFTLLASHVLEYSKTVKRSSLSRRLSVISHKFFNKLEKTVVTCGKTSQVSQVVFFPMPQNAEVVPQPVSA